MRKYIYKTIGVFALGLCFALSSANAQSRVEGQVSDEQGMPQAFTNVVLLAAADSAFIKGAVADMNGHFAFPNVNAGSYFCELSMVGYSTLRTEVFELNPQQALFSLGSRVLLQNLNLAEVEIVATKAMIEVRADMVVFNVGSTPSASGTNGLEMLAKAPGVNVDMDNNVQLLGKGGVQVYINGRPSRLSGNDLAALLQNMSSDNIEMEG
jgi:hypothetical protein